MEPKKQISISFEDAISIGTEPIRVNRLCFSNGTGLPILKALRMQSVASVFTENGTAPRYVVVVPITRLSLSETFRTEIESVAASADIQHIEFNDPHKVLRELSAGGEDSPPAVALQVTVTRENEIFIAGAIETSADTSFTFRSFPMASEAEETDAVDAAVQASFEYIRRHQATPKVLLSAGGGVSRCVVKKLHPLLGSFENVEVRIFQAGDVLKYALQPKSNPQRVADEHLQAAEDSLHRSDYQEAHSHFKAAEKAYPCEAVLAKVADFRARLRHAADTESGTQLKRFEASIETDPKCIERLWQDIAAKSPSGSRAAQDAKIIAKLTKKMGGNSNV